jgi:hypothetical protein
MRKQARRLWLGDWNRDQEPEQTDTFVILPEDEEESQPPRRPRNLQRGAAALAGLALLAALGFAVGSSGDDPPVASQPTQTQQAQAQPQIPPTQVPQVPQGAPQQGFGGPDLTGAEATKAAQAAVAKYPGDVERVTRGPGGGGYVVHVIQPDGNEVHVVVGDDFKVQGSDANSGPSNSAPGTPQ